MCFTVITELVGSSNAVTVNRSLLNAYPAIDGSSIHVVSLHTCTAGMFTVSAIALLLQFDKLFHASEKLMQIHP